MKIDIYTSKKNLGKHLSGPAGKDVREIEFPNTIDPDLKEVSLWETKDIRPEDRRVGMDSADIIEQIEQNGFAVHDTTIKITIK